jgi:trehalose synthase-fused probable maltokinase
MSADVGLEARIAEGDLHFLDGLVLLGTIASQRWFGGKSRDILDARVLDAGVAADGPPFLALAVVEVRYGLQTHDLYHLPLGFRPCADDWSQSLIAETEGWVVYDAIADEELTRRLVELIRADAAVDTGEAVIRFVAAGELPGQVTSIRAMGTEQSNSSLVLDDSIALKLYRRIEPGMNPELEVLRFLSAREFPHVAALRGYVSYEGRPLEATLAVLQDFVRSHGDGWVLTREALASGNAGWLPAHAVRLGEVTALLHNALGSDPADPHFAPEEPSSESLALLSASIDEEIAQVFSSLPDIDAVQPVAGRGEEVRERLRMLTHIGHVGKAIRTHGDYHLGQALWTTDEDWLILDFEGEPARSVPERRRKRSPLRDVAGMLRSFVYAESAFEIRRGQKAPPGWADECREAFLRGYLATVEPELLPPGQEAIQRLLTVFELEKAVYELRYELDNRPDWVSIPVAGIVRMLESTE